MDIEFLKTFGQIAGIGGLALVTFLILFRDVIVRLISMITVIGIGAWVWSENSSNNIINVEANGGV